MLAHRLSFHLKNTGSCIHTKFECVRVATDTTAIVLPAAVVASLTGAKASTSSAEWLIPKILQIMRVDLKWFHFLVYSCIASRRESALQRRPLPTDPVLGHGGQKMWSLTSKTKGPCGMIPPTLAGRIFGPASPSASKLRALVTVFMLAKTFTFLIAARSNGSSTSWWRRRLMRGTGSRSNASSKCTKSCAPSSNSRTPNSTVGGCGRASCSAGLLTPSGTKRGSEEQQFGSSVFVRTYIRVRLLPPPHPLFCFTL